MSQPSFEQYRRSTWQVHPRIAVEGLRPPCLQFALFPRDPIALFRERLMRRPVPELPARAPPDSPRQLTPGQAQLCAAWNLCFRDVTGDQVHLLVDDREVIELPPDSQGERQVVTTGTFLSVASDDPPGPRWLATKAVLHKGRALVWSVRVDAQIGRLETVVLTEHNALDLEVVSGG